MMTALQPGDTAANPWAAGADSVEFVRQVLDRYDGRFLACGDDLRRRMTAGTRQLLDALLTDEIRAQLPVGHRMRAFCIQHDLIDELTRLVADEAAGRREGAVVVGGRVYALYPYLRGVPRQDADVTAEVGVEHRLRAVSWADGALRISGRAAIERIAARDTRVDIVLCERASGEQVRVGADPAPPDAQGTGHDDDDRGDGFAATITLADLRPGHWDVHVSVRALGLVRQAPFGAVGDGAAAGSLPDRPEATVYVTGDGHLAIAVSGRTRRIARTWWRRLTRRGATAATAPGVSR
jgi:hypothetical protein